MLISCSGTPTDYLITYSQTRTQTKASLTFCLSGLQTINSEICRGEVSHKIYSLPELFLREKWLFLLLVLNQLNKFSHSELHLLQVVLSTDILAVRKNPWHFGYNKSYQAVLRSKSETGSGLYVKNSTSTKNKSHTDRSLLSQERLDTKTNPYLELKLFHKFKCYLHSCLWRWLIIIWSRNTSCQLRMSACPSS